MALCRGSNAGYGNVGLLEPRIYQVGEKSRFQRQRSLVSDTRVVTKAFSKTARRGCARGTRTALNSAFSLWKLFPQLPLVLADTEI